MRTWILPLLALVLAACQPPAVAPAPAAERILVSGAELEGMLTDPDLVVLHVAREREHYDDGHVPGARFLRTGDILTVRDGVPNQLPEVHELRRVLETVGVSNDSRVVLYGDWGGLSATRAFMTLEYLGHDRVAILDGGLEAWRADGRQVSRETPAAARGNFEVRPRSDVAVDADWVRERRTDPAYALIDARPRAHFTGEDGGDPERYPRWGRIAGAGNVFWQETLRDGERPVLKDLGAVDAMYRQAGATPGRTVVAYCGTGVQASHAYFTARLLGRDVRIYDGSFIDWSPRDESYPVATGAP
jgi:thiosulfate/3-mercaptopyruvate sulfurtransferase